MKLNYGQIIFSTCLSCLIFCGYSTTQTFAASLSVSPAINSFIDTKFPIKTHLKLTNLSNQTEKITIQTMPIRQNSDGSVRFITSGIDQNTKQVLKDTLISPNTLSLQSQETKQIDVTIASQSASLSSNNYYFSILFISRSVDRPTKNNKDIEAYLVQDTAVASIFLIGNIPTSTSSLHAAIGANPLSFTRDISPSLLLKNTDPSLHKLAIDYEVTDWLGHVYKDEIISNKYIFNNTSRSISLSPLQVWPGYIGPVRIAIAVRELDSNNTITLNKQVIVIPIGFLSLSIVSIIVLLLLFKRIRLQLAKQRLK